MTCSKRFNVHRSPSYRSRRSIYCIYCKQTTKKQSLSLKISQVLFNVWSPESVSFGNLKHEIWTVFRFVDHKVQYNVSCERNASSLTPSPQARRQTTPPPLPTQRNLFIQPWQTKKNRQKKNSWRQMTWQATTSVSQKYLIVLLFNVNLSFTFK